MTALTPEILAIEAALQAVTDLVRAFSPFKDIKGEAKQKSFLQAQTCRNPVLAPHAEKAVEIIWLRMQAAGDFDPELVPYRLINGMHGTYKVPTSICGGTPDGYM